MTGRFAISTLALLSLLSVSPATAQPFPTTVPVPGTPKPFTVPQSESFRLANGMLVTLVPYGVTPTAVVSLRIRAGALNQGQNVALPAMTAQMLREGAGGRTGAEVARAAAGMGGDLAVGSNLHETNVTLNVLGEFAPDAVRLISDIAQRPAFPDADLERVRGDLLRNLAVAKSQPQALAEVALAQAYYGDHPYGRLFPTETQLRGYTIADVRRFHSENYGAARARLYVAGRFDPAEVRAAIEQAFSAWPSGAPVLDLPAQPKSGPQVILVDRPGAPQSTIRLAFPAPAIGTSGDIPLRVSNALLGGAFSSRITNNIREAKGYTYSPGSGLTFNAGEARWTFQADVTSAVTGPAIKEVLYEIRRMQTEAIPEAEAAGMRQYLAGLFTVQSASPAGLVNQLANRDFHGLPSDWLERYVPSVLAVGADAMGASARETLPLDKMTLVVVGDLAKVRPQLRALPELRNARMQVVKPF